MGYSMQGRGHGDDDPVINWTRPMLERFKLIITKANQAKAENIMFDGHEFNVAYGLYLIEFLDGKLQK